MDNLKISGYGDNLKINDCRIGDLTPQEHQDIELKLGGQNYSPLENVIVSHVKDSSTLICRKPSQDVVKNYIEEEIIDGLCCYSAVNQGQLNQTIVDAVVQHLTHEKLPTVPRSIRHKYMSAFLLAATQLTGMDRVVPKVAGKLMLPLFSLTAFSPQTMTYSTLTSKEVVVDVISSGQSAVADKMDSNEVKQLQEDLRYIHSLSAFDSSWQVFYQTLF